MCVCVCMGVYKCVCVQVCVCGCASVCVCMGVCVCVCEDVCESEDFPEKKRGMEGVKKPMSNCSQINE